MKKIHFLLFALLAISLLAIGCGTQQPTAQTPETPPETQGIWARGETPAPPAIAATKATRVSPPLLAAVIVGGDLGGGDLLPANGDILSGTFTNVGTFKIAAGDIIFVDPGVPLSIQAALIDIDGTLDGSGAGFAGGASVVNAGNCVATGTVTGNPGAGAGGGGGGTFGCNIHGSGGSGGGHGGSGGNSASWFGSNPPPVPGGSTVGDATSVSIDQGSGGGSGSRYSGFYPGSSGAGGGRWCFDLIVWHS